ncbi:hypothetical protein L1049_023173 [Liquidambar formosana]|uniref:Uncharacterized protein n=1 Tax=Liquidambar formosana TaxID=63359 RepID=A0AAP0RDL0_LIQFO
MASSSDDISTLISHTASLCCDDVSLDLVSDNDSFDCATNLSLVGKLIADKVVNFHAIRAVVSKAWNIGDEPMITGELLTQGRGLSWVFTWS